jgi:phosphonate ABC transporter permease subunit PhnE
VPGDEQHEPQGAPARIVPPVQPRTPAQRLRSILYLLAAALCLAYLWASFVGTNFNLYPLWQSLQPQVSVNPLTGERTVSPPRAATLLGELAHPDLSWYDHDRAGSVTLDPRTGRPRPGTFQVLLASMNETVEIGLLGTLISVLLSFPLAFLAAGNLTRGKPLLRPFYLLTRAVLNVLRAFPPYILAILFVVMVGPGPFPGVLALALHSVGSLGKLFAEAIEQAEPAPVEAVRATGAPETLVVWYGILPQVLPQMLAFSLYRWDMNIRMTVILGIVGAGGIGFLLEQYIRLFQYDKASTAFLIILVAVSLLDWASGWLREKIG